MSVNNDISVNASVPVALSPERTMELILEALRELIDYELAVVLGLDGADHLRVRKAVGPLYTERLDGFSISLEKRRDLADILSARVPHLFREEEQHLDTYYEVLDLPEGHSCLVSPLFVGDSPIGLLTLDHRVCNKFTPAMVRFIGSLSKLISVSVAQSDASRALRKRTEALVSERNRLLGENADVFRDLAGVSSAWNRVLDSVLLVAGADTPVLVLGETGTGKELVARTIHRLSPRSEGPFVAVNCSALAPGLAESELFGHERGAFTGAAERRRGRFELADGGTLFLDEVGDLPIELQPKLLRVLQDGVFERVGGERSLSSDLRIIAATNVDLSGAVAAGRFREDLLYRLDVFPIRLPPLRERDEDAAVLAEHFAAAIRRRPGCSSLALSKGAVEKILSLPWPGNARELRNAIERAAILSRGASIAAEHIVVDLPGGDRGGRRQKKEAAAAERFPSLAEIQAGHIRSAFELSGGKLYGKNGAAELLGLKPTTLQSKMKKLGLEL